MIRKINYADKSVGGKFTASDANEIKTSINSNADVLYENSQFILSLQGGSLGSIKPTDAAPTPARNGNYTFSIGGNKPAWLTAETGITEVKAGDGVAVVYDGVSAYTYTHVDVSSEFVTLQKLAELGYMFKGVATPSTVPGTPDGKEFYIATEPGTYSNFSGFVVKKGYMYCVISSTTGWVWQLYNQESLRQLAETKFAIQPDFSPSIELLQLWGVIVQGIRVNWIKNTDPNNGDKWAVTYLYVQSGIGGIYDGRLTISRFMVGETNPILNIDINIYNYGYTKGYTGILQIHAGPFVTNSVTFDITLNCAAIQLDVIYKAGNESTDPAARKTWILPEFYFDMSKELDGKDTLYFDATTNIGKDYPIAYAADAPVEHAGKNWILDARVEAYGNYKVNFAFLNRTATIVNEWSNTVGIRVFDTNGVDLGITYFNNDMDFAVGTTGTIRKRFLIDTLGITVWITFLLDNIPNGINKLGVETTDLYYNKMPFNPYVYYQLSTGSSNTQDSFFYNATTNSGKDYPCWIDPIVAVDSNAKKGLQNFILYAQVLTTDGLDKYFYEVAYINRSATNIGQYDNMIQLQRRLQNNPDVVNSIITVKNIPELFAQQKFWFTYQWDNALIRLYIDGSATGVNMPCVISNSSAPVAQRANWQHIDIYNYIPLGENTDTGTDICEMQVAKVIGENLYIGAKYDNNNDILLTFKKCMFNDLMTFYNIGLAANSEAYPLNNPDRETTETLNRASSDNIGPLSISSGGWCGANHSYLEQGVVRTAENISFEFYADGKKLNDGNIVRAKSIEIRVKNRIYNPTIAPAEGDTILSSELCIEDVIYRVEKGNIFVSLNETFTNATPVTVSTYYGMQSMCEFEADIMTPGGLYADFTATAGVTNFTKEDYPDFHRFLERNAAKTRYQSTYLLPYADGNHNYLSNTDIIFTRLSGKTYHRILANTSVQAGAIIGWAGLYNWFTAIQDDDDLFVYSGEMQGKTYLFIDVKRAVDTYVVIPPQLTGQEYMVKEKSGTITTISAIPSAKGVHILSTDKGVVILEFKQ